MYEFEIMVTGYSVAVSTVSIYFYKFLSKKQMHKINKELSSISDRLQNLENDFSSFKKRQLIADRTPHT
jgi:hypothetical protein